MIRFSDPASSVGFGGGSLDRVDHVRANHAAFMALVRDPASRLLLLDGLDPLCDGTDLATMPLPHDVAPDQLALLGLERGTALFARLDGEKLPHGAARSTRVWQAVALLSPGQLAHYGAARSLVDWHARHRFCAQCGQRTMIVRAGWSRQCPACEAEHYPRVDPVVIMLAEHDGRVLLGRQHRFPPRQYSALAGFVEVGETLEESVARELFEEAGVRATHVDYVASQPWPFASSLMIACHAIVADDKLTLDETEIEHAFWADRAMVAEAIAGDADAMFVAPPPIAIANLLLRWWIGRER